MGPADPRLIHFNEKPTIVRVVGAASGAGGGLLTQVFTRGKQVKVPAESSLTFRLDRTLVLRPKSE